MKKALLALAALAIVTTAALAKPKLVKLSKDLDTGVTATVWVVDEITISRSNDSADVHLAAYTSEEAMTAGKSAVAHRQIRVHGVVGKQWFDDMNDDLVPRAITDSAFAGAIIEDK